MESNHEELIAHFSGITGTSPTTAQGALAAADWNLEQAVGLYYASQEGDEGESPASDDNNQQGTPAPAPAATSAAPPPSSSSRTTRAPAQQSNMRTFRDLQNEGEHSGSESEDDPNQDFFAGGEKSGLAVQNPNRPQDHFRNIMQQARENRGRPEDDDEAAPAPSDRSSAFSGRAQTLGGDDAPSRVIQDENAAAAAAASAAGSSNAALPRVSRTLHLWQDGFSIDDGPLHRFDDPANAPVLALINQGRAPLALLGVQPGQEVDLNLDPHKDEKYVAPKKKYKPFSGSGQRLGSPTPAASSSSAAATAPPSQAPAAASSSATSSAPSVDVDPSQPVIQLQIRLGDGSRLVSRFNTTHTIGDVYGFVAASSPSLAERPHVLMTTFPSKALQDKSQQLGDLDELKKGGVVVQKWT